MGVVSGPMWTGGRWAGHADSILALLLSHPLHQHTCHAAPWCPGFGVGLSPDHPPAPSARQGTAWAPQGHRDTRRRRHAGAVVLHIRTMLPPPLLQLQLVPPLGLAWSSACGPAQCHNGVLGPHSPALHHPEVLRPHSPHGITEQICDLMAWHSFTEQRGDLMALAASQRGVVTSRLGTVSQESSEEILHFSLHFLVIAFQVKLLFYPISDGALSGFIERHKK